MPRKEFLQELTPDFPPKKIYSFDENFRYTCDRQMLMDEVLLGTFESYERHVEEAKFSYKITADEKFDLEVVSVDEIWTTSFDYITEAFDIGEAAYRFFIVMPRVLDEGEVLLKAEQGINVDQESRDKHDHCDDQERQPPEAIDRLQFSVHGHYINATVHLCTDGQYILKVVHKHMGRPEQCLLDRLCIDSDLAKLLAAGYVKHADVESLGSAEELYKQICLSVMH